MIAAEGTIFAFRFYLSLLLIEGWVLDQCRAFDRLACVDAHLCWYGSLYDKPIEREL
jgi:hypothetical protein